MRKKLYKLTRIIELTIVIALLSCILSYQQAKHNAVKYLQIVTVHDQTSFERVKKELYHIVPPEVRRTTFDKEKYEGIGYRLIDYKVNRVRGKIKGYNHYVFKINWTSNGHYTIETKVYIKEGKVYDTYRFQ